MESWIQVPDGTLHQIRGCVVVGRSSDCTLVIKSVRVSRRHFMILAVRNEGDLLVDLSSTNGVALNGLRIANPRMLQHGDRILAGNCEFIYQSSAQHSSNSLRHNSGESTIMDPLEAPVLSHGTVLVNPDGQVRWVSQTAQRWMDHYFKLNADFLIWIRPILTDRAIPTVSRQDNDRQLIAMLTERTPDYMLVELSEEEALTARLLASKLDLTPRLAETLLWIVAGKSNSETGTIMGISERTVEKHIQILFEKLEVENRNAASRKVMEVLGRPVSPN